MRPIVRPAAAILVAGCCVVVAGSAAWSQAQPKAPAARAQPKAEPAPAAEPALKQVELTEPQVESVLAAQKDFDAIIEKIPPASQDKPDPKIDAQFEEVAKRYGFASFQAYNDVVDTISLVLEGFDPKTKSYVGPEAVIRAQLAAVQADKKMAAKDKKAAVDDLNKALKSPAPAIEYKGNIDLVTKHYDRLVAALADDD